MLRSWKILNLGVSRSPRTGLITMTKVGGDVPSTIWRGNLMGCTWTTHPSNMMNSKNIRKRGDQPTRNEDIRKSKIVVTPDQYQTEIAEAENCSLCPPKCTSCFSIVVGFPRNKLPKRLAFKASQNRRQWRGKSKQLYKGGYLHRLFPTVYNIPNRPKSTSITKINTSRRKYTSSKGNIIPIWRNSLGHILLDYIV